MAKWTRNYAMQIGGAIFALGLVVTVVSFTLAFAGSTPAWLGSYERLVHRGEGDWNLVLMIAGPILLLWGGWMLGEQLVLRRRFERLLDTPKKSEFASRRRDLEDISKRLPEGFASRIDAKESEFKTRRA